MADSLKSTNDLFFEECKSLEAGKIPFPSYGSGWGASQIFSSEAAWDRWSDNAYGGEGIGRRIDQYRMKLGDLSKNSLVMAAVRFLGDSIPEAPLQVKEPTTKDGESGQKGESQVVPDHRLSKLWKKPNESYPGVTLKKGIAFSLVLSGNSYIIKFFNNAGFPMELWWEPHWTIRPVWPIDGSEFISYYEVNRNGQWYPFPKEQVIHIREGLHPYNQRLGLSGNDAIAPELFGDVEAAMYYATLMAGSGTPNFAVSIDDKYKMSPTDIVKYEQNLYDKTSGSRKGRPLVMKGGRPYKLGFSAKELDLRESRYMAEDRFCAVQGIPAVVLELGTGIAHSIYKNVQEAQERAWRNYICPKLTLIEETLDSQLLGDFEGPDTSMYCRHNLEEVQALQEDVDARSKRIGQQYNDEIIMLSEARSQLHYGSSVEGKPELDKLFKSARGTSLTQPGQQVLSTTEQTTTESTDGKPIPVGTNQPPMLVSKKPLKSSDVTWAQFPEHLGSLNIPRTAMPQILSAHRGAMVQFLKGRGIGVTKEDVFPGTLKPAQAEYSPEKVEQAKNWTGPQRPLLASKDSYVADGHHQWAGALMDKPDQTIPIYRVDRPIVETLLALSQFPSSGLKDEKDQLKLWNGNGFKKAMQDETFSQALTRYLSTSLPGVSVDLEGMDMILGLLAADRILTFASEFPGPASLLRQINMLPSDNKAGLAYVGPLPEGGYRMVFNSDLWTDPQVMKQALDKAIESDRLSATPIDTVESTIDHELAHVLDSWVIANKNGDKEAGSDNPIWSTQDALTISRYSVSGPAEAFAEAFAMRQLFGIDKVPAGAIRDSLQASINLASQ